MLKRVAKVAIFGADPVDPLAVWIRLGRRLVQGFFAGAIHFVDPTVPFFRFVVVQFPVPSHFL